MATRRERSLFAFSQALLAAIDAIYQELDPKARKRVCARLLMMEETVASEPGDDLHHASGFVKHLHFIVKNLTPSTPGDEISERFPQH